MAFYIRAEMSSILVAPIETEIFTDTYENAKLYCFALNVDGEVGWRLPTRAELRMLAEQESDQEKKIAWTWYWSADDDYVIDQNLSVRAVKSMDY